jgi:hypothetical protein
MDQDGPALGRAGAKGNITDQKDAVALARVREGKDAFVAVHRR